MNPIGWCDLTMNPITGCTNCDMFGLCQGKFKCYAESFARRLSGIEAKHPGRTGYAPIPYHFAPTWHQSALDRIERLRGEGKRIFISSMTDWFCPGMPVDWVDAVIETVSGKPRHKFLILTKRPDRIEETLKGWMDIFPPNLWFGVSVTCQEDFWRIQSLSSALPIRAHKFVSFEPLLGPIEFGQYGIRADWCIIGALTGHQPKSSPQCTGDMPLFPWVDHLAAQILEWRIPLYMKDNLGAVIYPNRLLQQFPVGLQ